MVILVQSEHQKKKGDLKGIFTDWGMQAGEFAQLSYGEFIQIAQIDEQRSKGEPYPFDVYKDDIDGGTIVLEVFPGSGSEWSRVPDHVRRHHPNARFICLYRGSVAQERREEVQKMIRCVRSPELIVTDGSEMTALRATLCQPALV